MNEREKDYLASKLHLAMEARLNPEAWEQLGALILADKEAPFTSKILVLCANHARHPLSETIAITVGLYELVCMDGRRAPSPTTIMVLLFKYFFRALRRTL